MAAFTMKTKSTVRSIIALLCAILFSCSGTDGRITSYGLQADDLVISREKDGTPARPPIFYPGDKIFIRFTLSQYRLDSTGNMWIQEDLIMKDENKVPILTRQNLINDRVPPPQGKTSVPIDSIVTLLDTIQAGEYTIDIGVRDKIGGGAVYIEVPVTVKEK